MAMIMAAVGIVPYHLTTPELCLQPLLPLVVTFAAVSSAVHFLSLSFSLIAGVDCQNRLPLY